MCPELDGGCNVRRRRRKRERESQQAKKRRRDFSGCFYCNTQKPQAPVSITKEVYSNMKRFPASCFKIIYFWAKLSSLQR